MDVNLLEWKWRLQLDFVSSTWSRDFAHNNVLRSGNKADVVDEADVMVLLM